MSEELAVQNKIISEKTVIVEEIIEDIRGKTEIANVQQKEAAEKKAALDKQAVVIAKEEAEASKALEAAVPALLASQEALKQVSQAAITEIKALASPP